MINNIVRPGEDLGETFNQLHYWRQRGSPRKENPQSTGPLLNKKRKQSQTKKGTTLQVYIFFLLESKVTSQKVKDS